MPIWPNLFIAGAPRCGTSYLHAYLQRGHVQVRSPLVRYLFGNRAISRAAETLIPFKLRKLVRNTLLTKAAPKPQVGARRAGIPRSLLP